MGVSGSSSPIRYTAFLGLGGLSPGRVALGLEPEGGPRMSIGSDTDWELVLPTAAPYDGRLCVNVGGGSERVPHMMCGVVWCGAVRCVIVLLRYELIACRGVLTRYESRCEIHCLCMLGGLTEAKEALSKLEEI